MIAETSLAAYNAVKDGLGTRQQQVFDVIYEEGSASNEMIADRLRLPINCITPRVNELARYGFVGVEGLTKNKSGKAAKLWSVREPVMDSKVKELDCEG